MWKKRITVSLLAALTALSVPAAAAQNMLDTEANRSMTYYVDSIQGGDDNDGLSPQRAFRTLDRVNNLELKPGDSVLCKAGSIFHGSLQPRGRGGEGARITISRYGEGPAPVINAGGAFAGVALYNMDYVSVSGFEITNRAEGGDASRCGVYVQCGGEESQGGNFKEIHLSELNVHDVTTKTGRSVGGIIFDTRKAQNPVTYENVSIENCRVRDTAGNGITFTSAYSKRTGIDWATEPYTPSKNVVIRNNFVYNCGGDGIFQSCAVDPLIEKNTVYGTSWAGDTAYAGIWPHNSRNPVMQYNEAYGQRLVGGDGQGYDVDINCDNSLVQFNYSHHNEGGFLLICTSGDQGGYNDSVTVRNNLIEDDRGQVFTLSGPITNIKIHNNTVSIKEGLNTNLLGMYQWGDSGGGPDKVAIKDNIFAMNGSGYNTFYPDTEFSFSRNLYFGSYNFSSIQDPEPVTADPKFAGAQALYGIGNGEGFNLQNGSPAKTGTENGNLGARP